MKDRIILHIDMDAFFAAIEQRDNPSLQGKPVVIGADPRAGRGVVSTCSYEARRFGIHSAMPISEAYRRCKEACFLRPDMEKYKNVSDQIFEILYDFTDMVEPLSIDEAFLDISSSYHLFHSPIDTCKLIKNRIKNEIGLNSSIGIAPVKFVAKIASDFSKPDGLLEIKESHLLEFLWKLPVERLWGVGPKSKEILNRYGIKLIGELARHNRARLFDLFGEQGYHLHDLANGIDPREVIVDEEIKSVSHEHTFLKDISDETKLLATLSFLCQKVSRRLRKYGLKGKTITLKLRTGDFKTLTRAHSVVLRTNHYEDLYSVSLQLFRSVDFDDKMIRLLGVKVSQFEDLYVADSLFVDARNEKREKIHEAIDRIKDKFGEKSIHRGQ